MPLTRLGPLDTSFLAHKFEAEERDLLLRRCRLVFGVGAGVTLVLIGIARLLIDTPDGGNRLLGRWETVGDVSQFVSFALGFASLYLGDPGSLRLQRTAFGILAFNLILAVFNGGLLEPDYPPAMLAALVLFFPAAVIPWQLRYQILLAVCGVIAPLAARLTGFYFNPGAFAYWNARGGFEVFWNQTLAIGTGLLMLGALSVVVTGTLYNLRKTAHRARRMGSYTIQEKLGEGGMAEVYLASHARMVRPTAIKVLRLSRNMDESALIRFEREIRLASGLTHPNTIMIFDFGRADRETFYYAMEYLEGIDLEALVQRFGPLPGSRVSFVLEQVCGSLSEAHANGIVHRDLKPSNIFLTIRGGLFDFVKVLDFGIAKQAETPDDGAGAIEPGLTGSGQILGSPWYMSPEQWDDTGKVDQRADIYALGAVAYHLLVGHPPFTSSSAVRLLVDHASTLPVAPSRACESAIEPDLERVVLTCLEKRPEDRFQTVAALEAELANIRFAVPWTRCDARAWWDLHGPIGRRAVCSALSGGRSSGAGRGSPHVS